MHPVVQTYKQPQSSGIVELREITLPQLLAANNPSESIMFVMDYGYSRPKNQAELIHCLNQVLKTGDDEVAKRVADIHPHKNFIISTAGQKIIGREAERIESQYGAEGKANRGSRCPAKSINLDDMTDTEIKDALTKEMRNVAEKSYNLDGDQYKVSPKEWIPVVAVAGLFLIGVVIALRIPQK